MYGPALIAGPVRTILSNRMNCSRERRPLSSATETTTRTRRLVVNGEAREAVAGSLAALLDELGYGGRKVATAVNREFVAERVRSETQLQPGDEIEIVAPRQGG
jgi:sulfur carrier protein